ncbi:MAG: hypothetical protein IT581_19040 [Verrucomicrobiales bacterium]|nr:hypothetical protein [Verrucomicrobiales bacterium]
MRSGSFESPGRCWRRRYRFLPADPTSGTLPAGYLFLNTTDGGLRRHAGSLSREVPVEASPASKVGFHGAPSTTQRANADQAVATNLASVIILANELRAALFEKGLIEGEVRAPTKSRLPELQDTRHPRQPPSPDLAR